jgi:hypothetical protein
MWRRGGDRRGRSGGARRELRRQDVGYRLALNGGVDKVHGNGKLDTIQLLIAVAVGEHPDLAELGGGQLRATETDRAPRASRHKAVVRRRRRAQRLTL